MRGLYSLSLATSCALVLALAACSGGRRDRGGDPEGTGTAEGSGARLSLKGSDTMVVLESSEDKAAAYAFIDYILRPEVGKQVVEYTLYKMPNAEVMAAVGPKVIKDYPTLAISPAELFEQETQTDLGEEGTVLWAEAATEIKA